MSELTVIPQSEAPVPAKRKANEARLITYENYIAQVTAGNVGVLQPGKEETPRMITHRIAHAAKRVNTPVHTWTIDGTVYFELANGTAKATRKPKAKAEAATV